MSQGLRRLWLLGLLGACARRAPGPRPRPQVQASQETLSGLYWSRWEEVPEGVRVALWLWVRDGRMRGSWDLPPWHGELSGEQLPSGRWAVTWREEGTVAVLDVRQRALELSLDPASGALRGTGAARAVELLPVRSGPRTLAPGVFLGRWTGLPAGMAVETRLDRGADGLWRAVYRYQEREGSFVGELLGDGALAIRWTELSPGDRVARGQGLLRPFAWGLRGTYGVEDAREGIGFWSLEPF